MPGNGKSGVLPGKWTVGYLGCLAVRCLLRGRVRGRGSAAVGSVEAVETDVKGSMEAKEGCKGWVVEVDSRG